MKIDLSPEAVQAVIAIVQRLQKTSEFVENSKSVIVSQIILNYQATADTNQLIALAERATSPKGKRKALLKKLLSLTAQADAESLRQIEQKLNKFCFSAEKNSKNEA